MIFSAEIKSNRPVRYEKRALCAALKEKPLSITEAAQAVGKDIYTLDVKRLIRDGAVQLCGLMPTDVMRIRGDFSGYDREASLLGAPISIFLEDVAAMLGTRAVIPHYHEVANALGAIVGSVSASCSVQIKPDSGAEGTAGYTVFGNGGNRTFKKMEEAAAFALSEAKRSAGAEARRHGAKGKITVTSSLSADEAEAKDCTVYLESAATACAVGTMGF